MVFPVTRGQKTLTRKWICAKFAMTHLRTGHGVLINSTKGQRAVLPFCKTFQLCAHAVSTHWINDQTPLLRKHM